jgi:hypothetical protein
MDELEQSVGEEPLTGNFPALGQEILRSRLARLDGTKGLAHTPTVVSVVIKSIKLDCQICRMYWICIYRHRSSDAMYFEGRDACVPDITADNTGQSEALSTMPFFFPARVPRAFF